MIKQILVLSMALLAAPLFAAEDAAKAVEAAERGWADGITKNDFALLDKVLANDLTYTHSNLAVDTKESYIGKLKAGTSKYTSVDYSKLTVQVLSKDTAITICRAKVTTVANGKPNPMDMSLLHVFKKNGKQWQMVAHQSARLP
ncbi:MAG TPA: nuclear transport factor 2 family protein [Paludibaculum sp.]|jgi:ketosteroid isomerase-like protein